MTKLTERHQKTAGLTGLKANETAGEFTAIVAVFGNVDLGGDRIMPGAFTKSLSAWEASGDPIPVLWNHDRSNPLAHIGKVLEAREVPEGLWIRAALDTHKPFAKQVYDLLAERRVKEFSFSYAIKAAERKNGAYELQELDLIEVGPTLQGMNEATRLLAVKSFAAYTEAEAGERLSIPKRQTGAPQDADLRDRLARLKAAAKPDVEEEVARIFARLGIPVPGEKSAAPAPPVVEVPALRPAPRTFAGGAVLGGFPGRRSCSYPGCGVFGPEATCPEHRGKTPRQMVGPNFQPIDLDANLAEAEVEAKRTAKAAEQAAEQLEAAREAVRRHDERSPNPAA